MVLYESLKVAYAKAIYIDGTKTFPEIKPEYVEPVKQLAATKYTVEQIEAALASGYITQEEYEETLAYKA